MGNKENQKNKHKEAEPIIYSEMYKITFDGYNQVGKSSIMKKYLEGKEFKQSEARYILHPYIIYTFGFPLEERNIGVQVFDCKSSGDYGSAAPFICRRTDVFIFVYDISDKSTFVSIKKIIPLYKERFEEKDGVVIIVGNKIDLPRREVQRNLGENLAKEYNAFFFETSTTTGEGINQLFELCINNIVQRAKNEYHPIQENNLTLGSSMTSTPNITEFNTPKEKPNNNNINKINSQEDNYEKLYKEERLKNEDLKKEITKLQYVNEYLEKELKIEREKNFSISNKDHISNEDPSKIIKLYEQIRESKRNKKFKRKIRKIPI